MKKKLCLLLCAVLCLLPLGACQGEELAEGALPQPPGLTVTCGEESVTALGGGYDWRYQLQNGETANAIADAAHPLEESLDLPVLEAEAAEATLTWDGPAPEERPHGYVVVCLPAQLADNPVRLIDVGIAAQTMALAACTRGLGCCMVRSFDAGLAEELSLPDGLVPALVLAVGGPAAVWARRTRPERDLAAQGSDDRIGP